MVRTYLVYPLAALILSFPDLAPAQPRWDIAGTFGGFGAHTADLDQRRYQDDWFHAVQSGLVIGRHLSTNLKVEIEGTLTGRGRQYVDQFVTVPGFPYPYPVVSERETSVRSLGAAVAWQFRDNEWVHPFVRAGVSVDVDRERVTTWDQVFSPPDRPPTRVADRQIEGPTTTTSARALLGGGAKLYVTPRAFFRTEAALAVGRARQHVMLRLGFGMDF
jgi:hypothetical protein